MALRILIVLLIIVASAYSQTQDQAIKLRLAQSYEQGGDFENAAKLYQELLTRDSTNYVYFDGLRRMYMQLKKYDEAISIIERRLTLTPTDVNLRGALGSAYYKAGNEKEADAQWEQALALERTNQNAYRAIAGILIENRLLDKTADLYRRARVACKDPNLFAVDLAQLLAMSMDYAGATVEFVRWLKQNPTQLAFLQAKMSSFTGKEDARMAAIGVLRAALKKEEDQQLYELLAWTYLEGRDFGAAFEVYKTLDKIAKAQGGQIYTFAERAFKERAFDVASKAYLEAINTPVSSVRLPYAKYGYACSLKELGVLSDSAQKVLPIDGVPVTESQSGYAGALRYFKKIIDEHPHTEFSAKSYYQIGTIQFEKFFDLDGAIASFEQVEEELPGLNVIMFDVSLKIGQILVAKGDTAAAAKRYQKVAAAPGATPDQQDEANFRLAEIEYFGDKFDDAVQRLGAIAINPKADYANDAIALLAFLQENKPQSSGQALAQFSQADFLARQRRNTEAIAVFLDVIQRNPQALLVDDALMRVASLQSQAHLYSDAVASYTRLLTQFKESSIALDRAQFNLGEIYDKGLQDRPKAIAAYEKLLADYPQSLLTTQARKRIRELRGDSF